MGTHIDERTKWTALNKDKKHPSMILEREKHCEIRGRYCPSNTWDNWSVPVAYNPRVRTISQYPTVNTSSPVRNFCFTIAKINRSGSHHNPIDQKKRDIPFKKGRMSKKGPPARSEEHTSE